MSAKTDPKNLRVPLVKAFFVGFGVHALLLALSLSEQFGMTTYLLLVVAFPGALVDVSSEMIHPSQLEGMLIATLASAVNGAAYALGAFFVLKIRERRNSG